jgi:hypothetical protein
MSAAYLVNRAAPPLHRQWSMRVQSHGGRTCAEWRTYALGESIGMRSGNFADASRRRTKGIEQKGAVITGASQGISGYQN